MQIYAFTEKTEHNTNDPLNDHQIVHLAIKIHIIFVTISLQVHFVTV